MAANLKVWQALEHLDHVERKVLTGEWVQPVYVTPIERKPEPELVHIPTVVDWKQSMRDILTRPSTFRQFVKPILIEPDFDAMCEKQEKTEKYDALLDSLKGLKL